MMSSKSGYKTITKDHIIETNIKVPKLGVMLIGLGGNNGSTMVAGSWPTRSVYLGRQNREKFQQIFMAP
jgi:hypothetical protein